LEPDKCEGWEWVDWKTFASDIVISNGYKDRAAFEPLISLVKQRHGFDPAAELDLAKGHASDKSYIHDSHLY
jgi:hypothetical protein